MASITKPYTYKYNIVWRPKKFENVIKIAAIEASVKAVCEQFNFTLVELSQAQDYFCITILVPESSAKPGVYIKIIELKKRLAELNY